MFASDLVAFWSLQKRDTVEIDIILSPVQAQSFNDRINADGTDAHAIDDALAHVKSEDAEASVPADLDAIRALIEKYSGGFGTLNDTVKQFLRRWFVSQGGVKVAARQGRREPNIQVRTAAGTSSTDSNTSNMSIQPMTGIEEDLGVADSDSATPSRQSSFPVPRQPSFPVPALLVTPQHSTTAAETIV